MATQVETPNRATSDPKARRDVLKRINDEGVEFILLWFTDIEADRMEVWSSGAVAHIPKDDIAKQLPRVLDELSPFSVE